MLSGEPHRGCTVVLDLEDAVGQAVGDRYPGRRGPGMPDHVGERLLDDPVGRQVDARREVARLAGNIEADFNAGRRRARNDTLELGQSGRWRSRLRAIALTQQAERRAQLLECFLAGLVDRDESAPGLVRIAIEQVSPDTGLDADHRDPMGQDIVQLARDSNALLTSPPVGLVLAAPLDVERSLLDLFAAGD